MFRRETLPDPTIIPFCRPYIPPRTVDYIRDVILNRQLGGSGKYTDWCEGFLTDKTSCAAVLLTNSGSSALDTACSLIGLKKGDEVIMPSFTFPSAASAVVKRGGVPVFADISPVDFNIDPVSVEAAVTQKTRALIVVHYAGVPCDMATLSAFARKRGIPIIDDAAHAYDVFLDRQALGTFGRFGIYSFQQTKNLTCGEGGALIITDPEDVACTRHYRDKGTDHWDMVQGKVAFYQWISDGAGIAPNEITAAFLRAQLEEAGQIKTTRRELYARYGSKLARLARSGKIGLPNVDASSDHNAHIFFVMTQNVKTRNELIRFLNDHGITASFHYKPLHSSAAGKRRGRAPDGCPVTEQVARTIVRLPLFHELGAEGVDRVCRALEVFFP